MSRLLALLRDWCALLWQTTDEPGLRRNIPARLGCFLAALVLPPALAVAVVAGLVRWRCGSCVDRLYTARKETQQTLDFSVLHPSYNRI